VTPAVQRLPAVELGGDRTGFGDGHARSLAAAGDEDVVPREYRHGDDVRRVHWRSTARRGELMVRREEQARQNVATVLLDTRAAAHRGTGPSSSFEWSVSAAASICAHLTRRGWTTRLVAADGDLLAGPRREVRAAPGEQESFLLDALAEVSARPGDGLGAARAVLGEGGAGSLVVALLAGLTAEDVRRLAGLPAVCGRCVAIVLDTAAWDPLPAPGPLRPAEAGRGLAQGGWQVLPASAATRLPELWRAAGGRSRGHGLAAGTGAGA
jgi:uncharacterized protein (DUF58 family)